MFKILKKENQNSSSKIQKSFQEQADSQGMPLIYSEEDSSDVFSKRYEELRERGFRVYYIPFIDNNGGPCVPYNFLTFLNNFYLPPGAGRQPRFDEDDRTIEIIVDNIEYCFLDDYVVDGNDYYKKLIMHNLRKSLKAVVKKSSVHLDYSNLLDDFPEDRSVGNYTAPDLKILNKFKEEVLSPLNGMYIRSSKEFPEISRTNIANIISRKVAIFIQPPRKEIHSKGWIMSNCIYNIFKEHLLLFLDKAMGEHFLYASDTKI